MSADFPRAKRLKQGTLNFAASTQTSGTSVPTTDKESPGPVLATTVDSTEDLLREEEVVDEEDPLTVALKEFLDLQQPNRFRRSKDERLRVIADAERQASLPLTVFYSKIACYSTMVKLNGKKHCVSSTSREKAEVASSLAQRIAALRDTRVVAHLLDELTTSLKQQQREGKTSGGLPSDVDPVVVDSGALGFVSVSLEDQTLALEEIRRDRPEYKMRDTRPVSAGDLRRCGRCSFVFKVIRKSRTSYCTQCEQAVNRLRKYSYRSAGILLVQGSVSNSKRRDGKRQRDGTKRTMLPSEMTLGQIGQKLEQQQFRCSISNLWLHPSVMSPERKDESQTYIVENWSLVHIAFQSFQKQWTPEKARQIPELRKAVVKEPDYDSALEWCTYYERLNRGKGYKHKAVWSQKMSCEQHKGMKKVQVKVGDGEWLTYPTGVAAQRAHGIKSGISSIVSGRNNPPIGLQVRYAPEDIGAPILHASLADAAKHIGCAEGGVSSVCHGYCKSFKGHKFWFEVDAVQPHKERPWFFQFARNHGYHTVHSTAIRNEKRKNEGKPILAAPTLTIRDMVEIMREQGGRCAYLDIPLSFETGADWHASLERVDRDKGYSRENCRWVAGEVNTAAFQWTREFAENVWPR